VVLAMSDTLKIFVSYCHQDTDLLDALLEFLKGLENEGVEFWTDRKIRPGELWDEVIKANIQDAAIALVLVSQGFLDSKYCQDEEIKCFLAQQKHLFPVILSPCDWQPHIWLSSRQFQPGGDETIEEHYTDPGRRKRLFLNIRKQLREWVELIQTLASVPTSTPPPAKWTKPPYPGLRHFRPEEAPIFFGREPEIRELLDRFANPGNRFIAIIGASGSGKSSLVAAGLIPRLSEIAGGKDWVPVRFTPGGLGDDPFVALAAEWVPLLEKSRRPMKGRDIADRLRSGSEPAEFVQSLLEDQPETAELLLFIDQFEELFTLAASEYQWPFITLLVKAVETPRVRTVLTLRADFYHCCVEDARLARLLRTGSYSYPLAAPELRALLDMITGPAALAGLRFEAGLPGRILEDTGREPGALALLAFALAELDKARTADGCLTHTAYDSFKGVQGAIAQCAETTFSQIDAATQTALGEVFRELVDVDERGVATRRRAALPQVSKTPVAAELVTKLTDARLLVTSQDEDNQPLVEVAHEALLKSWPRLAQWIETVRDDLRLRSQLQRDADNWKVHDSADRYRWTDERAVETCGMLERLRYQPGELERRFLGPLDPKQMRVLVDDLDTPADLRGTIGIRLALLGDTRPGIGLGAEGLPDFRWASIPGTEAVRASGQFPNFTGFRLGNGARPDPDPEAESNENWPEEAAPLEIKAFKLAIYPVTVAQFRPFVEQGGYRDACYWSKTGRPNQGEGPGWWKNKTWTLPNQPVIGVTWCAVEAYCNWLNDQLQLPRGTIRLLTEAEWEWVARGPVGRRYPWGEEWDTRRCNSLQASLDCTSAVGCFPGGAANWWLAIQPDSAVVHDLAGNVWEWIASEYSQDYSTAHQSVLNTDHSVDRLCVLRGGSWLNVPGWVRGAVRYNKDPHLCSRDYGFRLARTFH
jgi:formylglycine-generating enzyme required for sulfatase activity